MDSSNKDMGAIADWFEHRPINLASRTQLASKLRSRLDFVGIDWADEGKEVKMLDYACGPGFMSRLFAPHVSSISAIDVSPAMVEAYNSRIPELGPSHAGTRAVTGDLLSAPPTLSDAEVGDFDLVAVGAALHHFPDPGQAVEVLAGRLRRGGVLYVLDMWSGGEEGTQGPKGFTEGEMRGFMGDAGLVEVGFERVEGEMEIELLSEEVVRLKLFVARCVKGV